MLITYGVKRLRCFSGLLLSLKVKGKCKTGGGLVITCLVRYCETCKNGKCFDCPRQYMNLHEPLSKF